MIGKKQEEQDNDLYGYLKSGAGLRGVGGGAEHRGTNRTVYEKLLPGGKGLNVSAVLQELGIPSTAFGFVAGFTGEEICRRVREYGINTRFLKLEEGNSRINVKLKSGWPQTRGETEINGMGPQIPPEKLEELKGQLSEIGEGDTLVLAGSIPPSLPATVYRDIMEQLQSSGARIAVDAAGAGLGRGPVTDWYGVVGVAGRLLGMGARKVPYPGERRGPCCWIKTERCTSAPPRREL